MAASRCTACLTNWPRASDYDECPECGAETRYSREEPIDAAEAASRKNHADFERYLEREGRL